MVAASLGVFLFLFQCLSPSLASLELEGLSLGPFRSEIIWREDINEANFTLVNLIHDRAVFDYCDLSHYTPEHILPLLQANFR